MHLQQVIFTTASVIFALVTTGVIALPIGPTDTMLSGLTDKPIGIDASSGVEDVALDLAKRHKHSKGRDDGDSNENGDNAWLSSSSDDEPTTMPSEKDESTPIPMPMDASNSEEGEGESGSIADLAVARLAKNPVDQMTSHGITTSQGQIAGLKADTRHFLNNQQGKGGAATSRLSSADSPALLHGHPSADYYEGALNPNLGGDSLSSSLDNLESLLSL